MAVTHATSAFGAGAAAATGVTRAGSSIGCATNLREMRVLRGDAKSNVNSGSRRSEVGGGIQRWARGSFLRMGSAGNAERAGGLRSPEVLQKSAENGCESIGCIEWKLVNGFPEGHSDFGRIVPRNSQSGSSVNFLAVRSFSMLPLRVSILELENAQTSPNVLQDSFYVCRDSMRPLQNVREEVVYVTFDPQSYRPRKTRLSMRSYQVKHEESEL
jgi:hypothetical protein